MRLMAGFLVATLAALPALRAGEAFPGQNDLAAGLACYRNLEMECARQRLERALAEFSPEEDGDYIAHVRKARWVLALLHVSFEDLHKAEREFSALLLVDPGFELPKGDHPPKVVYVFNQAKKARRARRPEPGPALPPEKVPPSPPKPVTKPARKSEKRAAPPKIVGPAAGDRPILRWQLSAEGRFVGLFGDDAEAVSSGPGAALAVGMRSGKWLVMQLGFGYAWHPAGDDPALQAMSLEAEGLVESGQGGFALRLGGGLGVLSMGTRDRYDHWGLVVRAAAVLAWPGRGRFGMTLGIRPSLVITAGGQSFYLPVGLAGEVRW